MSCIHAGGWTVFSGQSINQAMTAGKASSDEALALAIGQAVAALLAGPLAEGLCFRIGGLPDGIARTIETASIGTATTVTRHDDAEGAAEVQVIDARRAPMFVGNLVGVLSPTLAIIETPFAAAETTRTFHALGAIQAEETLLPAGAAFAAADVTTGVLVILVRPHASAAAIAGQVHSGSLPVAAMGLAERLLTRRDGELSRLRGRINEAADIAGHLHDRMSDTSEELFRARHSLRLLIGNLWGELLEHRLRKRTRGVQRAIDARAQSSIGSILAAACPAVAPPASRLFASAAGGGLRIGCYVENTWHFGGLEQCLIDLAAAWRGRGAEVVLISREPVDPNGRFPRAFGGPVVSLAGQGGALAAQVAALQIETLFVNVVADGVADVPADVAVIEVLHNIYFTQRDSTDPMIAAMRSRCDWFISVAPITARYAEEFLALPKGRSSSIPHGLHIEGLYRPPLAWMTERRARKPFRILAVGNIYPQKNILGAIEAVAALAKTHPEVELHVAGGFNHKPTSERVRQRIAESGMAKHVIMHGLLDRRSLSRLYSESHMLAFPSLYEGFGLVLLEAQYFGLPIVATRTGFAVEAIEPGRNGVLLPTPIDHAHLSDASVDAFAATPSAEHIEALRHAFADVITNYEAFAKGGNARMDDIASMSIEGAADAYLDVIRSIRAVKRNAA